MFEKITPESAGISSRHVTKFIKLLERRGLIMHSVLLMRGDNIFAEYYWKPFDENFLHRMYSETKSYVGVAIGLLEEDGLISLDEKISAYFPEKIDRALPPYLAAQTVRDMLTMTTCGDTPNWFHEDEPDRTRLYFNANSADHPAGMIFKYDSPGSQVLCALVEKITGKNILDFLRERIFRYTGTFERASILKTKNDDSWGDSALLCTTRDMASFARFVMNYGTWNGKRLMNEAYLRKATSRVVDNNRTGFSDYYTEGYGYQIWRSKDNSFSFNGMGAQLTICMPDKDLIFVCTAYNYGYDNAKGLILSAFFEEIADNVGEPLPEDRAAYKECQELGKTLELSYLKGEKESPFADVINGVEYICEPNRMGITRFSLVFADDGTGEFRYTNAQGDKVLPFGFGRNVFGKFPHYGYFNLHGGVPTTDGFRYGCAASAEWCEEKKLHVRMDFIDVYFGNLFITFSFKDDTALVKMVRNSENCLYDYDGMMIAKRK